MKYYFSRICALIILDHLELKLQNYFNDVFTRESKRLKNPEAVSEKCLQKPHCANKFIIIFFPFQMFMGFQFSKRFFLQLQMETEKVCCALIASSPRPDSEEGLIQKGQGLILASFTEANV